MALDDLQFLGSLSASLIRVEYVMPGLVWCEMQDEAVSCKRMPLEAKYLRVGLSSVICKAHSFHWTS